MKYPILALCLVGVLQAFSNSCAAQGRTYAFQDALTPTFKTLADTVGTPQYLSKSDAVTVLGLAAPKWAIISRGKNQVLVATRHLQNFDPADLEEPGETAAAPLPTDASTGRITFTEVIQIPGVTQTDLYLRGKVWFINHFKDSRSVISTQEKEAGLMIGRGWTKLPIKVMGLPTTFNLWYTVRLSFKDGRYKYEITDLATKQDPSRNDLYPEESPLESWILPNDKPGVLGYKMRQKYLNGARDVATGVAETIKNSLAQPPTGGDW